MSEKISGNLQMVPIPSGDCIKLPNPYPYPHHPHHDPHHNPHNPHHDPHHNRWPGPIVQPMPPFNRGGGVPIPLLANWILVTKN